MIRSRLAVFLLMFGVGGTLWLTTSTEDQAAAQAPEMNPYSQTIPGWDVKFDMIPIAGGKYQRGSPANEPERGADEGPQHFVEVKSFYIGKFEVTWNEFDIYCFSLDLKKKKELNVDLVKQGATELAADAVTRSTPPYTDMTFGYGHDNYPAICMTHHAAMEYCRWLAAKTGKPYRLPTEAEWEYACRAGTTTAFSFGNDAEKIEDFGWYIDNADAKPHPIGKKKPNPWGLYDMHGNVAEWCIDQYEKDAYSKLKGDSFLNPFVKPNDRKTPHVARGGSWDDEALACRSAARKFSTKEWWRQDPQRPQSIWWLTEGTFVGLRVVCPVQEYDTLKGLKSAVTKESLP